MTGRGEHLSPERQAEFDDMVAMKLPLGMIASRMGLRRGQVYWRLSGRTYAKQGPHSPHVRAARVARIKANIEAYPNKSLFGWSE